MALVAASFLALGGTGLVAWRRARLRFTAPPLALCTDNAAMIAWAGIERFRLGLIDDADLVARPRWPLDQSQPALIGSGKKGAKA